MIGVVCKEEHRKIALEFFELFKTPWEFARPERKYEVLLSNHPDPVTRISADMAVLYCTACPGQGAVLSESWREIPSVNRSMNAGVPPRLLAGQEHCMTAVWMGYDLFAEIDALLTRGQQASQAAIPSVEWHIERLRGVFRRFGVEFLEIPSRPAGYSMTVVLTHDLDHVSVRDHMFDHTMAGFLVRASVGSAMRLMRNRISARGAMKNWAAVATLPFVYAGVADDFWAGFAKYAEIESGKGATYFAIPFKGVAGSALKGQVDPKRAAGYDLRELAPALRKLSAKGYEIGVHGLDAWCSEEAAGNEMRKVSEELECKPTGIRMHWLYFDENSPRILEHAGYEYDSTVGYNETVGFRAGTAQVYRPPGTTRIVELPLIAMDTALFYSSYLNLSPADAASRLQELASSIKQHGGVFTVNWHDRSICPERQWGEFYCEWLKSLEAQGCWFANASEAVRWHKIRRSVSFEEHASQQIRIQYEPVEGLPGLIAQLHTRKGAREVQLCGGTTVAFAD